MSSLEPWPYSYPAHLHWEQTEPGEFLWDDVTTYTRCRESTKKGGPAEQHGIWKEHSSGKGGLMLALKGQTCWMYRFFFFVFPWTIAFQSWKGYFCVHMWSTGMAAELHMGLPTWRDFLYLFWLRENEDFAHIFWVSSSVAVTSQLNICCNSIKINNALFDRKTSLSMVSSMLQLESVGKGKIFWSRTSPQYATQCNGSYYDVPNLS